ncbi:MAG: carbohydrate ABC transporter permease [Oscillospiraceae bacterium]
MLVSVFPLLFVAYYSFTDYYLLAKGGAQWVAGENYRKIISDPYFRQALWNTLYFCLLAVVFETGLGLALAAVVNSLKRFAQTLRILLLLPMLVPGVTAALTWQMMLSNNYGIINQILGVFGLPAANWLMDPAMALYAVLVVDIWQFTPFCFMLLYAAMQSVPAEQYEAAQIDGAGGIKSFFYITLPNIGKVLSLVVLLRVIDSFRLFDKVNILTKGGPANSTATITQYIYQHGIKSLKIGYSSAATVIMTLLMLLVAAIYIRRSFKKE